MTQIWGHLTLIGDDFDLDYVTRELGTVPMTQRKPDEILGNGKAFGHCEWGVETERIDTCEISVVADALMQLAPGAYSTMAEIAKKVGAQWHILFRALLDDDEDEYPRIVLESPFIRFAAEIGAGIGVDII